MKKVDRYFQPPVTEAEASKIEQQVAEEEEARRVASGEAARRAYATAFRMSKSNDPFEAELGRDMLRQLRGH